jgi:hypothetical protein
MKGPRQMAILLFEAVNESSSGHGRARQDRARQSEKCDLRRKGQTRSNGIQPLKRRTSLKVNPQPQLALLLIKEPAIAPTRFPTRDRIDHKQL